MGRLLGKRLSKTCKEKYHGAELCAEGRTQAKTGRQDCACSVKRAARPKRQPIGKSWRKAVGGQQPRESRAFGLSVTEMLWTEHNC